MNCCIAGTFDRHVNAYQVLARAGLRRLPDGRYTWPSSPHWLTPNDRTPWILPATDGRTATAHNWPGLCRWTAAGMVETDNISPWALFVSLVAGGDPVRAVKLALRIPAIREAMGEELGGLANV